MAICFIFLGKIQAADLLLYLLSSSLLAVFTRHGYKWIKKLGLTYDTEGDDVEQHLVKAAFRIANWFATHPNLPRREVQLGSTVLILMD